MKSFKGASLGLAPALPENICCGQKDLPGTNTLVYLAHSSNYGFKKIYKIGPWFPNAALTISNSKAYSTNEKALDIEQLHAVNLMDML